MIVDIRGNRGGSDKLGLALASRLTSEKYIAYFKQAAIDFSKTKQWSAKQPKWIQPVTRPSYYGGVAILTDYNSVSAAETFTMALMARSQNTVRIGRRTRGAFSGILPCILPNGWLVGLQNERYIDASGASYDEVGIAPQIEVFFEENSMREGLDNVIDSAIDHQNSAKSSK